MTRKRISIIASELAWNDGRDFEFRGDFQIEEISRKAELGFSS